MIDLATRYTEGVREVLASRCVPWTIVQIGARAEYRFTPEVPRNGGESAAAHDAELDEYMHLFTINRGILMTPFHNMALMSPADKPRRHRPPHRGLRTGDRRAVRSPMKRRPAPVERPRRRGPS